MLQRAPSTPCDGSRVGGADATISTPEGTPRQARHCRQAAGACSRYWRCGQEGVMHEYASFGAWIQQRRKALDLTQAELAERVGCALGTIRKIETDERRPSKQFAARLAEQLQLAPDEQALFLKAARAELGVDRLAPPTQILLPTEAAASLPHGTVTFLFADIEGSTQLWERHPQSMGAALVRYEALLRQAITVAGGVVFKLVGDVVCAAFASAKD